MTTEFRAEGAPPPIPDGDPSAARRGPHRWQWMFHAPPVTGPGGVVVPMQIPPEWADDLAKHIERLGVVTRDDLVALADENGDVNLSALPAPSIRHDPPPAGPTVWANPGPWVPVSTPAPEPSATPVPDLTGMSDDEAAAAQADAEAVQEALRRREIALARRAEADIPDETGEGQ